MFIKRIIGALVVLCCTMPAFAQTPKAEIFGGYSFAHQDDLNINKGWNASIAGNFNQWLGIEGDLSGHYYSKDFVDISSGVTAKENVSFLKYRVGPKFSFRSGDSPVAPFAHFLIGGARSKVTAGGSVIGTNVSVSDSTNGLAGALGGGIDVGKGRIAVRAIQADYSVWTVNDLFGVSGTTKGVRLSFGVVFRLN